MYNLFILSFRRDVLKLRIQECHAMVSIQIVKAHVRQGAVALVAALAHQVQLAVLVALLDEAAAVAAVGVVLFVAATAAVVTVQVALAAVLGAPVAAAAPVAVLQVPKVTAVVQTPIVVFVRDRKQN